MKEGDDSTKEKMNEGGKGRKMTKRKQREGESGLASCERMRAAWEGVIFERINWERRVVHGQDNGKKKRRIEKKEPTEAGEKKRRSSCVFCASGFSVQNAKSPIIMSPSQVCSCNHTSVLLQHCLSETKFLSRLSL